MKNQKLKIKNKKLGHWSLGFRTCLVIGIWLLVITAPAVAVPQYLNYQGVLRDNSGSLVTGTKQITFKIYDAESGGTAIWSMTSQEVRVSNGLYTVQLGPLGYAELGSGRRWLEVTVGTEALSPRLEILSVAYAVTAASAESAANATNATNAVNATNATNASNADTVDNLHANSIATAGQLLALDSDKQLKGLSVSAEASGSNYAMYINGRLGAGGICVGSNIISAGDTSTTVIDSLLSASSMVFVSGGVVAGFDPGSIYAYRTGNDRFTLTITNAAPGSGYPFNYLIIN